MSGKDTQETYDMGLVGLGVMGRNFALNLADGGTSVAGYDRDSDKVDALADERAEHHDVRGVRELKKFVGLLSRPRAVLLLVPAGDPVDAVIRELTPLLSEGDLLIDSGNSRFTDTARRADQLEDKGLLFLGMGMSGGESGARHGPSLMPGGSREGWERVQPVLEKAAAQVDGSPCVAYLGPGAAGHYVKMVHNGIEYALMQLIAETYALMRRVPGMGAEDMAAVYSRWNGGPLASYLLEITADIFRTVDSRTGKPLVEMVRDVARQKGTGEWTAADALSLREPALDIAAAVMMRDMSAKKEEREQAGKVLPASGEDFRGEAGKFLGQLESALHAATVLTYAQGMAMLRRASREYDFGLDPATVARIWRGGCIIRAALLEDIRKVFGNSPDLENLMLDPGIAQRVLDTESGLRHVARQGIGLGVAVPGFLCALSWLDAYRSPWLPANLVMAQRDCFGSHGYERTDEEGMHHSEWRKG